MFQIIDVDTQEVVKSGFSSEVEAESYAEYQWGEFWWSNETPYAVQEVSEFATDCK